MRANDPAMQAEVARDERRAVMSTVSPTLLVIEKAYGENTAAVWLAEQLTAFNEFCGKREKMDGWQVANLARRIFNDCSFLKASEIMLFLYKYSSGDFGPLYGVIDPQELMHVLKSRFIPWRAEIAGQAERESARAERESWHDRPGILKPDEVKALRQRLEQQWKQQEQDGK